MAARDLAETSDARLREALDAMPHKVWMVRPDGPAIYYNRAMREFAGAALDLPDRPSRERALIHGDDLGRVAAARDRAIIDNQDWALEVRLKCPDGSWRWHRLNFSMLWGRGRVEAWLATATDIHDLREALLSAQESGEQLRLAAQAAQLGTYSFDLQTREHVWSPELKAIFGLAPGAVEPPDVRQNIHADDRERGCPSRRESFDPGSSGVFEDEHRIIRPDGSIRWVFVKGRMSFTGEGESRVPKRGAFSATSRRRSWARRSATTCRRISSSCISKSSRRSCRGRHPHSAAQWQSRGRARALIGRLHALAHAQEFVASGAGGGALLSDLVEAQLASFGARAHVAGPSIVAGSSFAQMFALIVHELATNAAKHGALASASGRVAISWKVGDADGEPTLQFAWIERGRAPAEPPTREGFEYALAVSLTEVAR